MSVEDGPDTYADYEMEPYELTVLSKKFESIIRTMTQTLMNSARSGVINGGRDFSSAITLFDGRQFMYDEGLPVHSANIHLVPEYTLEKFDDISEGDCFLTNSAYAGNSHHADYTLHVPVFFDGEPLFWSINRAHQADVGAPQPSTYLADAKNIYEEGPHFPSVRIQDHYEDKDDIVRMCKLNIRASDTQWYGDFRAQVGCVRTGEEQIQELCEEYGLETVRTFAEQWIEYGDRMMRSEIEKLPEGEVEHTTYHDPIPYNDAAPEGVPVNVKLSIDHDEEKIYVDLTDNIENVPAGVNLCEATTIAGVYGGIFYNIDSSVPHNHGSISRVEIEMDRGKIVGKPEFPIGTSVATTNICDELFNATQAAFGELGEPYGVSEGIGGIYPHIPVISGTDFRRDDEYYVNQLMLTCGGGACAHGHDGWITYGLSDSNGVLRIDSVEIAEQKYPILIHQYELLADTAGAGKWRGAPGVLLEYGPREDPMTAAYINKDCEFPPQGILGGEAGTPVEVYRRTAEGETEDLPNIGYPVIDPGETLVTEGAGGGGYGDPYDRDPKRVLEDVREDLVSIEVARETYGVAITETDDELAIDEEATRELRGTVSPEVSP